jgi:hypothetical protein
MIAWIKDKECLSIIAMLAMTGFFWMLTPDNPEDGASIFPHVVMGMMVALAGIKIVTMLLYPQGKETKTAGEPQPRGRFFFVLASMIAYVAAVEYIGFYVSSFVFFFGVTLAIQLEERSPRSIAIRLAVVLGFLLFLWILFTKVLMAQLPKGMLF